MHFFKLNLFIEITLCVSYCTYVSVVRRSCLTLKKVVRHLLTTPLKDECVVVHMEPPSSTNI